MILPAEIIKQQTDQDHCHAGVFRLIFGDVFEKNTGFIFSFGIHFNNGGINELDNFFV
jgi:hypothetical protein